MLLAQQVDLAIFAAPTRHTSLDYRHIDKMEVPLVISSRLISGPPEEVSRDDLTRYPQVVVKSSDEKSPDTGLLDEAQ